MRKIDPNIERERLAARYASMSDLELKKVGSDPASLTEWARGAFQEEMDRRRLEWKLDFRAAKPIVEHEVLIPLGTYADRNTAGLTHDFLSEKGIKVYFCEQDSSGEESSANPQGSKGTQLLVRANDAALARMVLAEKEKAEQFASPGLTASDRPVILRRYRDLPQAFVEKSVLDDAGIICYLQDDNVIRMDWLWSNAMGGIKLIVREQDLKEAEGILSEIQLPEKRTG